MPFTKMGTFTFDHTNQQDDLYKAKSAAEIKAAFDSRGNELKTTINNLIDALQATTGAGNIGTAPIVGVGGTTVQSMLESLKTLINQTTLGQIVDGSITEAKLSFDPATQVELNNHDAKDATLTAKGHVQLSSSTSSTSEILAATPKAVKDALDAAKTASVPLSQKASTNGVATLGSDTRLPLIQAPARTYGSTTLTGTFPVRTGTSPYTWTIKALSIPLTPDTQKVTIFYGNVIVRVFKGFDKLYSAINSNTSNQELFVDVNLGLPADGTTFTGTSNPWIPINIGYLFADNNINIDDMYIQGNNLIIKMHNGSTNVNNSVSSNTIKYIMEG